MERPASLGERLRRVRADRRETLQAIADRMATSVVYVSNLERGKKVPIGDKALHAVASAYRMPFEEVKDLAWRSRATFELETTSDEQKELAVILTRQWNDLPSDVIAELRRILREREEMEEE